MEGEGDDNEDVAKDDGESSIFRPPAVCLMLPDERMAVCESLLFSKPLSSLPVRLRMMRECRFLEPPVTLDIIGELGEAGNSARRSLLTSSASLDDCIVCKFCFI